MKGGEDPELEKKRLINVRRGTIDNLNIIIGSQKLEEYKKKLAHSSEVIDFVNVHSKYIERTLGEKELINLFTKYELTDDTNQNKAEDDDEMNHEDKDHFNKDNKEILKSMKNPISEMGQFYDESVCFKRAVTDIQWSNKFPEILLAGYSKSDEANVNDPHGLVLLWSMAIRKKPEYQFTCQSELTKVVLHPYNPKLIIGATHTGQIIMWDTRGKPLPIMKTPPGGKYHSHPIYALEITGSSSNSNITSISNDGILCTWSANNLNKATKRIELKAKKKRIHHDMDNNRNTSHISNYSKSSNTPYSDEFGVICMTTQEGDANNLFIGTDDSEIYQITTHQG
jgi:WD40 repeat protein